VRHRFVARGGERLDKLLAALLPDLSRVRLQALISQGHVLVAGKPAKASMRPAAGAELSVEVPAAQPIELLAEDLALPVLFEDAHLLVIDKPAGMVVHPGAGVTRGTVVHGLLHQVRDLAGISGEMRPGIVHRLDKDTSGCLVVAKTEAALRGLQAQFKSRTVEKSYRALVHGKPPDAGELDTLFGRHPVHRKRFSSRVQKGRRAVTRFRVLARAPGAAWLEVELLTGRTHQIRAHLADAGWPIFGDALYGRREKAPVIQRQALHAFRLAFSHPATGARMACEAPLPADLRAALRLLGLSSAG
jgi:23S rRNA pseudouridine1911/1915/1917 synthase